MRKDDKKKSKIHPRSQHHGRYPLEKLVEKHPELGPYVHTNQYGNETINFFDSDAVRMLNTALLKYYYDIQYWEIPDVYLCPPVPGRADYIHHIADHLAKYNNDIVPKGENVKCIDLGIGANCIYPIIGNYSYGWSFVGIDIDNEALKSAQQIIDKNNGLSDRIKLKIQENKKQFLKNVVLKGEQYDLLICNPPFYSSKEEALQSHKRKLKNLKAQKTSKIAKNFGGVSNELWTRGGELRFIKNLIAESSEFSKQVEWFSCLVSKGQNLPAIYNHFDEWEAKRIKTIDMGQGNKISRIVVWSF